MLRKKLQAAVIVLVLIVTQLGLSPTARAATYTVTNTNDSGPGSLRKAINDANLPASMPPHLIQFNIDASTDPGCDAGTGVCTIQPASPLPALTGSGITIDGYTQTGAAQATATTPATLKIEIDGTNAGESANGLDVNSPNNVIKGLVINRFSEHGIYISGSGATGNVISGSHIGTDVSGTAAQGNGWRGVYIRDGAQNNTVGGDTPGERNVISGNDAGVYIYDGDSNTVCGNYIGTNGSGTGVLGNVVGVYIGGSAQNNNVEGNVIGNGEIGVRINDGDGNTVSGNYIGTDVGGTADLGNTEYGVRIDGDAQNNTIGPNNIIVHSGYDGVDIHPGTAIGNVITQNSISSSAGLGIDLWNGGNGDIAAPVIAAATAESGLVNVTGTACAACTVELFANGDADGEGETFIGDTVANSGGVFIVTVPAAPVFAKPYLTTTATDVVSGTSEFSVVYIALLHHIYLPLVLK